MIVSSKREQYDGSWRLVLYDTDEDGKCVPRLTKTEFDDDIDTYYVQRVVELDRLRQELVACKISPVCFFMKYYHMDIKDLAARMRLAKKTVKKHLTSEGFDTVKVEELKRYARIFDVAVSDFFSFIFVNEDLSVKTDEFNDRLVQCVTISVKDAASGN